MSLHMWLSKHFRNKILIFYLHFPNFFLYSCVRKSQTSGQRTEEMEIVESSKTCSKATVGRDYQRKFPAGWNATKIPIRVALGLKHLSHHPLPSQVHWQEARLETEAKT